MNYYDENTHKLLDTAATEQAIREEKGYAYEGQIKVGMTEAVPERYVHIPGSETAQNPDGCDRILPAVAAKPVYEDCMFYHEFTRLEQLPTWEETMEAQLLYTALITDTLLEE